MHHLFQHPFHPGASTLRVYGLLLSALWALCWLRVAGAAVAVPAATPVPTNITASTTWTRANSPYLVTGMVTVQSGATLTIQPGVEVRFQRPSPSESAQLQVRGAIRAVGTETLPILFTGAVKQPGAWDSVIIISSTPDAGLFEHVVMEYGGFTIAGYGMLQIGDSDVRVRDSTFRHSATHGISLSSLVVDETRTIDMEIAQTHFDRNRDAAIRQFGVSMGDPRLSSLTATGNGVDAVVLDRVELSRGHVWERMGLPYVARGSLRVLGTSLWPSGSLVVEPGVTVKLDDIFLMRGKLSAVGTSALPITFTGVTPTRGAWEGLSVDGDGSGKTAATLANTRIEWGGNDDDNAGGVFGGSLVARGAAVTVTDSLINHGLQHGIIGRNGLTMLISNTTVLDHPGDALRFDNNTANPVLRGLRASGNGRNAVVQSGEVAGRQVWERSGLPYFVEGAGGVTRGSALDIEPGVLVQMAANGDFDVHGTLTAIGEPRRPITFTGVTETSGSWRQLAVFGSALLRHCDIGYGGAGGVDGQGMLVLSGSAISVQDCRIHGSDGPGITVGEQAAPFLDRNRIEANRFGLRNDTFETVVDARNNWWGAASGPFHPTSNPQGTGDEVSDDVLFRPWLTSPSSGLTPREVRVVVHGPGDFAPGSTQQYAVSYENSTGQTIKDAVLRVLLPTYAEYLDNSGGGIYWPQRHQLFWKLGTLPPGATGVVATRVQYFWGLPTGLRDSTIAELSGEGLTGAPFDVQPYLSHTPITIAATTPMSADEVAAERQSNPQLNQLYAEALAEGFKPAGAQRLTLGGGAKLTELTLLRPRPIFAARTIWGSGSTASARTLDRNGYMVSTTGGTVRFDIRTGQWETTGTARLQGSAAAPAATFGECVKNCIIELIPGEVVKHGVKAIDTASKVADCAAAAQGDDEGVIKCGGVVGELITGIPGVGQAIDIGICNSKCQQDPDSFVCTKDLRVCDPDGFPYGIFGIHSIKVYRCNLDTGRYFAGETVQVCALCEKCVGGTCVGNTSTFNAMIDPALGRSRPPVEVQTGPRVSIAPPATRAAQDRLQLRAMADARTSDAAALASAGPQLAVVPAAADSECDECRPAKDPNAKYGVEGDVTPGQLLRYTVTIENEGAGTAFGVFVLDRLSEHFDASTLVLEGDATYSPSSRLLLWKIGELAPKGEDGSKTSVSFSVRLKADLPTGTVVRNQAVVHFPSVPEETPTNTVVNVVQPLAGAPQTIRTVAGTPVTFTLTARGSNGNTVTYTVVERPRYGTLSGTGSKLTYTPMAGFSGQDQLRFTVTAAGQTSRPAEVRILVAADPKDNTAPAVVWVDPANGAVLEADATPRFAGPTGALFAPLIRVQFNEQINPATLTGSTATIVDGAGRALRLQVSYDSEGRQAALLLREPLRPGTTYVARLTRAITDLRGNPLADDFRWSFRTGGTQQSSRSVYLPLIMR